MEGMKGMEVKESSSEDAVAYYNYSSYLIDPAINLRKANEQLNNSLLPTYLIQPSESGAHK